MSGENRDFFIKTGTITAAALVVIFCAKIWIVDALLSQGKNPGDTRSAIVKPEGGRNFDKTKNVIDWKDAANYVDKYVEFTGTIAASHNNGKICYLNFDRDYKKYIALLIFSDTFKKFPDRPEKYYLGKKVKVEGRVKEYKGRLEIILGSPEQIKPAE